MADEDNGIPDDENDAPPAQPAWTPPATPEELNAIIEKRISRERKRFADYDQLKADAQRARALDDELASDKEKAVKAAREEERNAVLKDVTPRLVRTAFKAEAKGVLSSEQLTELLEDVDLSRFITEDGDVDESKIAKKIAALAPKREENGSKFPDLGGGKRGTASTATNMNDRIRQLRSERG